MPTLMPTLIDLTHTLSPHTTPATLYPGDPPFALSPHATILRDGYSVHTLHLSSHTGTHLDAPSHFVQGGRAVHEIPLRELIGRALVLDLREALGTHPSRSDTTNIASDSASGSEEIEGIARAQRRKLEWDDLEEAWTLNRDKNEGGEPAVAVESLAQALQRRGCTALFANTGWSALHYPRAPPRPSEPGRRWSESDPAPSASAGHPFSADAFFAHPYFSGDVAIRLLTLGITIFGCDTPSPDETPYAGTGGAGGYAFHEAMLGGGGLIVENLANLEELADLAAVGASERTMAPARSGEGPEWIVNIIPLKLEGMDGSPVRAFAYREGSF